MHPSPYDRGLFFQGQGQKFDTLIFVCVWSVSLLSIREFVRLMELALL